MSVTIKRGRIQLTVNGSVRRVLAASVVTGPLSGVAQCTVSVEPQDGQIAEGDTVELRLSHLDSAVFPPVFTGEIDSDDMILNPTSIEARTAGLLRKVTKAIDKEDPAATAMDTSGIPPEGVGTP